MRSGIDKERGLYRKFDVRRTDGKSEPGQKHEHCRYFVLDIDHDEFAAAAIAEYASRCAEKFPRLADDLRRMESVRDFILDRARDHSENDE